MECESLVSLQWLVALKYQAELTPVLKNNIEQCLKNKTSQGYMYDIHGMKISLGTSKEYLALVASKKKQIKKNLALDFFLSDILFLNMPEKQNEKIKLLAPLLEKLEDSASDYFSLLAQAYFYAQIGNQAKVNSYLNQIYLLDVHGNIFSPSKVSTEQARKVIENILTVTKYLKTFLDDSNKYEMLMIVTKRFFLKGSFEEYAHFFDIERSLHSLREESRKITTGLAYPTVWFPVLLERTSLNEAVDYLEKSLQLPLVKSQIKNFLWLFEYHYPRDEDLRASILKQVSTLNDSNTFEQKDLFFRLMENKSIKNHYSEMNQKYKRPMFVEKRSFYLSMLESNTAVSYAVYNLMLLGDYNLDYIHWLVD